VAKVELELDRLAQIQAVMGEKLPEIVRGITEGLTTAISQVDDAMRSGELERAAKAAHAGRNDALMIGAKQLLSSLTTIETSAREGQTEPAMEALADLHEIWPPTLEELQRIAAGPQ
jgi:hypothetical protein